MPRAPTFVFFVLQIVVSLIGIAVIVALFATMHTDSVEKAAVDAVTTTLKASTETIAAPFRNIEPQLRQYAMESVALGDLCNDGRRTLNLANGTFKRQLPPLITQPLMWAIWDSFAFEGIPKNSSRYAEDPYDPDNLFWGDCGCTNPADSRGDTINDFCVIAYMNNFNNMSFWAVTGNNYSTILQHRFPQFSAFPQDTLVSSYVDYGKTMTQLDAEGRWYATQVSDLSASYPINPTCALTDTCGLSFSVQIIFHVPMLYFPNGKARYFTNGGLDARSLTHFVRNLNISATRVALLYPRIEAVLANDFNVPNFRLANQSVLASADFYKYHEVAEASKDLSLTIMTLRRKAPNGNFDLLRGSLVVVDEDYIFGASPIQEKTLRLTVVTATDKDFYFAAGRRVTVIAVVLGLVVFVLLVLAMVFLIVTTLLPLQDVAKRLNSTAKLKSHETEPIENPSFMSEIATLQESYNGMHVAVESFMRYVPKEVVMDLLIRQSKCQIRMSTRRCTMMFMDIVSFTTLCSRVSQTDLGILIECYFRKMSSIIMAHHGVIDKFIGDCIMAVWGAPFDCTFAEVKSVLSGLLMQREMNRDGDLKQLWESKNAECGARIGINTGEVLAGNMGTDLRMSYTVVGDPVNLSARLESGSKQFGIRMLVSGDTVAACEKYFAFRALIPLVVVGRDEPTIVYQCLGLQEDAIQADARGVFKNDTPHRTDLEEIAQNEDSTNEPSSGDNAVVQNAALRQLPHLLNEALQVREPSLIATEKTIDFCNRYTTMLIQTYIADRNFSGVLEEIKAMESEFADDHIISSFVREDSEPVLKQLGPNTSANILRSECGKFIANPPPVEGWNGAYVASEK